MVLSVHKYILWSLGGSPTINDYPCVDMPTGARVLHAGMQAGNLCVWALVDPTREKLPRRFRVAGTGHHIPVSTFSLRPEPNALDLIAMRFVSTVRHDHFVWHVFDLG